MKIRNQKVKVENKIATPVLTLSNTNSNVWNSKRRYR